MVGQAKTPAMPGCLPGCWVDGGPEPDPDTWVQHEEACPNLAAQKLAEWLYAPMMKKWGYADEIIADERTRRRQIKAMLVYAGVLVEKLPAELALLREDNKKLRSQVSSFLDLHQKQMNDLDGANMETVASWLASYQMQIAALKEKALALQSKLAGHQHEGFPKHVTKAGKGVWDKSCPQCLAALTGEAPPARQTVTGPWVIDRLHEMQMDTHQRDRLLSYTHFLALLCNMAIKAALPPLNELPFETYERVYGLPWPGGKSETIIVLLQTLGVTDPPGSEAANLRMQELLLMGGK